MRKWWEKEQLIHKFMMKKYVCKIVKGKLGDTDNISTFTISLSQTFNLAVNVDDRKRLWLEQRRAGKHFGLGSGYTNLLKSYDRKVKLQPSLGEWLQEIRWMCKRVGGRESEEG